MEWVLLLVNVVLVGLLGRIWSSYQAQAGDLRRRHQAAQERAAEHLQQVETTRKETAVVEAELPEIEAQAKALKDETVRAEVHLARMEMNAGSQH